MQIMKFKLLNGGDDGIVVEAKEYLAAGQFKIVDDVTRTRRIMISDELKQEIQKLKYYFLNITGHWIPPYSKFYDTESGKLMKVEGEEPSKPHLYIKDIWNKLDITGASSSPKGFVLTGKMETVQGKWLGLATPFITQDDDLGFYNECMDVLDTISLRISNYLKKQAIPIEQAKERIPEDLREGKTTAEIVQLVVDDLEGKGAIIMISKDDALPEKLDEEKTEIHTGTGSIDSDNINSAEEEPGTNVDENIESHAADEAIKENVEKVNTFEKPASDAEFKADLSGDVPKPKQDDAAKETGDMTDLEYSESTGTGKGADEDVNTEKIESEQTDDEW